MISHKNISKMIGVVMAAAVAVCLLAMAFPQRLVETLGGKLVSMRYESELFDTDEIMKIDIRMDTQEWEDMLANASAEEYYSCDVTINGQEIYRVGIRPKGNTSLSSIAMDPDTDRFSFKLEFDRYVEGQTCLGLDKLVLNNNYADATNMKEAVVYDMYRYLNVDASFYNYAEISVNGEYWGVYLALEAIEDSFLLRNYGTEDGALYKPENMEMGGAPSGNRDMEEGSFANRKMEKTPFGEQDRNQDGNKALEAGNGVAPKGEDAGLKGGFPARGRNSMDGRNGGSDLNYTDDEPDSYSSIWEGAVGDTGKQDHRRVVTALKNISEGTDLEEYLDVDNVLKYMAVHTFSVNMDSLSGNMAHNYYLYEHNGKLNILPWDYNLAFGGMGAHSASEVINDAIDTPFDGTDFFDALLEEEEYRSVYHEYLRQLAEEYVAGGKFEETYHRIRNQIDTLVREDPTAFYSYEEYETAVDMLYRTVVLRAESIQGQLDGRIPSTDDGQKNESSGMADTSAIDIEAMGGFDMGRTQSGFKGRQEDFQNMHGNPEGMPEDFGRMPENPKDGRGKISVRNGIIYIACLTGALLALGMISCYRRIPKKKLSSVLNDNQSG